MDYVLPSGEKITNYYDKETGLKAQFVETAKTPQGEVSVPTKLQDYKEVNGIKFPHSILINNGMMSFKLEMATIEVNPALDDAIFKVQ